MKRRQAELKMTMLIGALLVSNLASGQSPPNQPTNQPPNQPTNQPTNPPSNPFSIQIPQQGGLPQGVMPPTQGPTNNGGPGNVQVTLPPSSGGFNPGPFGQGGGQGGNSNNSNNSNSQSNRSTPLQSEIVLYNPTPDVKPIVIVKTSEGEFKLQLDPSIAPNNVKNFVELAFGLKDFTDVRTGKKTKRPFYTGLNCHRVLKSFVMQCGCPFGNGKGGPGYTVADEIGPASRFDRPGVLAMAPAIDYVPGGGARQTRSNSNGSQFFITFAPLPEFDEKFTVIGKVISGMDTIRRIASTPTGPTDRPIKRVIIFSMDPEVAATVPAAASAPNTNITDPMAAPGGPGAPGAPGADPFASSQAPKPK